MNKRKIDPATTIIPFIIIAILCIYFTLDPENSSYCLSLIRWFITDKFGLLFLMTGLSVFLISLWIAFSNLGRIRLGGADEKPIYSFFAGELWYSPADWQQTFFSTLSANGSFMQENRISRKWDPSRNGIPHIRSFTGDSFPGPFMQR